MRRLAALLATALLALAFAAPAAAAQGPDRTWLDKDTFVLEGYCGFDVLLADEFAKVKELAFPADEQGNQRVVVSGVYRSVLTNLESGASIRIKTMGSLTYTFRADGTIRSAGHGNTLVGVAATDVSDLGQGLFIVSGQVVHEMDADFNALSGSVTGTVRDLCAELAAAD
jgi:hypothetical protein